MKARKDARSTEQLSKTPALRTYGASGQRAEVCRTSEFCTRSPRATNRRTARTGVPRIIQALHDAPAQSGQHASPSPGGREGLHRTAGWLLELYRSARATEPQRSDRQRAQGAGRDAPSGPTALYSSRQAERACVLSRNNVHRVLRRVNRARARAVFVQSEDVEGPGGSARRSCTAQ